MHIEYYKQVEMTNRLGFYLENFKKKSDNLWNCRCPICGDSVKDKSKARGYFFKHYDNIIYKCHNCGVSMPIILLLKNNFHHLYNDFLFESVKKNKNNIYDGCIKPKSSKEVKSRLKTLDGLFGLKLLSNVSEVNSVRIYCVKRGLGDYLSRLYYIPSVLEYKNRFPQFEDRIRIYDQPAVGIPHFSSDKRRLNYMQLRLLEHKKIKYLTLTIDAVENTPKIFGLERINYNKQITITEGAFDSLFLDNAISISGLSDWKQIIDLFPNKESVRFVVDNDYRYNQTVRKILLNIINSGFPVVLFPKKYRRFKDVNDMVNMFSVNEVNRLVDENTFCGLKARLMMI